MDESKNDSKNIYHQSSFYKFQERFINSTKYSILIITFSVLIIGILTNANYTLFALILTLYSVISLIASFFVKGELLNNLTLIGFNIFFFVQAYFQSSAYVLTLVCILLISISLVRRLKFIIIFFTFDLLGIIILIVLKIFSFKQIIDPQSGIALVNNVTVVIPLLIISFLIAVIISQIYVETIKRQTLQNKNQILYQEQILKSSHFKSDFMASMSHELRTPLNSIIGFTDILLEKFYGEINEKQGEYLSNVKTSAEHLLHLISEILDISKIEAGKMDLNIEDIQLQKILNEIEISFRPEIEKKKLKFEVIGLNSNQVIQADFVRFKEIIYNLLSNAINYTKEGMIKLEIIELEELWKFKMIDTGIGIKEEHLDSIFKEFVRGKSTYAKSVEGTGLGLSLTKRLVELHGGNISFTSRCEEGSTFTFTLPKKRNKIIIPNT